MKTDLGLNICMSTDCDVQHDGLCVLLRPRPEHVSPRLQHHHLTRARGLCRGQSRDWSLNTKIYMFITPVLTESLWELLSGMDHSKPDACHFCHSRHVTCHMSLLCPGAVLDSPADHQQGGQATSSPHILPPRHSLQSGPRPCLPGKHRTDNVTLT